MSGLIQGYVWIARLPDALNNPQAKAILARIADGVNDAGEGVRPLARSWIAEDVALSESSVKRWLTRLRDAGMLSSEGGGAGRGDAPVYRIDVDLLASMIPEARRPAPFRRAAADENKGVTGDPLSEKGGHSRAKRGSPEAPKGGHSCDPHYFSTRKNYFRRRTRARGFDPRRLAAIGRRSVADRRRTKAASRVDRPERRGGAPRGDRRSKPNALSPRRGRCFRGNAAFLALG